MSTQGLDLMNGLLALDPKQRTSAKDALEHCWFTTETPPPTPLGDMPQASGNKGCLIFYFFFARMIGRSTVRCLESKICPGSDGRRRR